MAKPVPVWSLDHARAVWARKTRLDGGVADPVQACAAAGWVRTLGGIDGWLTLRARARHLSRADMDAACADGRLRVVPAVRGCIYLVPGAEAGLALKLAEDLDSSRRERERAKAGFTLEELERLGELVLGALADGPLSTPALRKALPDGAIRSLGPAGKKIGVTSTLPPALRELEFAGRIRREFPGGRLDTERYAWRAAHDDFGGVPGTPQGRLEAMAGLILERSGPVTTEHVAAFVGCGKRAAEQALVAAGGLPVAVTGFAPLAWIQPGDRELPPEPPAGLGWLAFEDSLVILHGGPWAITEAEHHGVTVRAWGRGRPTRIADASHLASRCIVRGGRLIGLWEVALASREVVWAPFGAVEPAIEAELAREARELAAWIADELGHGRTFSIDNDERVAARAAALRSGADGGGA